MKIKNERKSLQVFCDADEGFFELCDGMMFVMMSRRPSDDDVSETIETGNR